MPRICPLLCLILPAFILAACASRLVPNQPAYPAVMQADCAPWDGAAFTLSIPFDTGRLARISIYRPPHLPSRTTFSFPDPTGRIGNAMYQPEFGEPQTASGTVTFYASPTGAPVEGEFDLLTAGGLRLRGTFHAEWLANQVMCG